MNILYLISSLDYGGAEKQTVLDANMMVSHNEVFLGFFFDGPLEKILDSRVKAIKIKKKNYLFTAVKIAGLVKQNNIQLIHSSLFASMIISAVGSLFCKAKVVWHFHNHESDLPWFHRMAYKMLARSPGLKKICFVNKELIWYFRQRGFNFPRHKIKLLYNNASVPQSEIEKMGSGKTIIGYIGRLVSLKRVEYLIELAQYLIDNKFVSFIIQIVGDGDQRNLLEQEVRKKELQSYISFVGFQQDVGKYYHNFDLFVNPSREECLSIALIDAGICKLPSVAFDAGGNNEIIIDSQTGYIVNTKEEFFVKVFLLVINKTLRGEMGAKAKEHCINQFSEEAHYRQLESLYKEVME